MADDTHERTHPPDTEPVENAARQSDRLPDEDDPETWLKLPGYKLIRELTRGGQAVIFEAVQESTSRRVAVKLLSEGPWSSERAKNRMEQEVRILAALDHPNIVSVIDRGETEQGWMFFVLEFVEGRVFSEYLDEFRKQHGPPQNPGAWAQLLRLFMRICNAVNAAHLRGIVHRDIKPSNILIDAHGEPHVLDFGVARPGFTWTPDEEDTQPVTASGEFLGSLQWASPEQADGNPARIDIRSDVYSLGIILYEMLTGEFPYEVFGKVREVLNNIVNCEPRPPSEVLREQEAEESKEHHHARSKTRASLDATLDGIALKALAKRPDERYQSAGDFARDIGRYLAGQDTVAGGRRVSGRRSLPVMVTLGAILVLLGGLVWRQWGSRTGSPAETMGTPSPAYAEYLVGYRVDGNDVEFMFDPRRYDLVRLADGTLGKLSSVQDIHTVSVAGPFNDWNAHDPAWTLKETAPNRFSLRTTLSAFKGRYQWPFKFVVNRNVWVGAPEAADNKEVVVEDTATYNLVLFNPTARLSEPGRLLFEYRKRIDEAWPGQGSNLALDEEGRYHLTLTHLSPSARIRSLDPLHGIPLTTLDASTVKLTNIDAVREMKTLTYLKLSEATRSLVLNRFNKALALRNFTAALDEAEQLAVAFEGVPAFEALSDRLVRGVHMLEKPPANPREIPAEAQEFQGHHYGLIPAPMTWNEARAFCEDRGAYLAAPNTEEEQVWITKTFGFPGIGQSLWLGGTDEQYEGNWGWLSTEPWVYENWSPPEPNNEGGAENALAMKSDGWWFDAHGDSTTLPFLIEWPR